MSSGTQANGNGHGIFQRFFHSEVSGGIVLLACTIFALAWANSPAADSYFDLTHKYLGMSWGNAEFKLSLQHWVNDALMVVFFFVVGLEIKREILLGELSSVRKAALPVAAAIGGMVVPAALYAYFNAGDAGSSGWGIPMATDIAFALGVLALLGKRVPLGLKVFLTALAIADDMGAVLVIAVFYTEKVRLGALLVAAIFLFLLFLAARVRIRRVGIFVFLVVVIWVAVFASGVHATVAGILVALMIPVQARIDPGKFFSEAERSLAALKQSDLRRDSMVDDDEQFVALHNLDRLASDMLPPGLLLERYLHPTQAFLILPLFAFFNAGVRVEGNIAEALLNPISLGIITGLVVGKQVGIFLFSWLAVKSGRAALPDGVDWSHIWGVSCLAGIGFTMSLFIGELAFRDPELIGDAKIGILAASLLAGALGFAILKLSLSRRQEP